MKQSKRTAILLVACIGGLTGLFAITQVQDDRGNGGYPHQEYRFTILSNSGDPIQGAELIVLDADKRPSMGYPIIEYDGATSLASDDGGILVCHHVNTICEFTVRRVSLFGYTLSSSGAPEYCLVFRSDGRERTERYADIANIASDNTVVWEWRPDRYKHLRSLPFRINPAEQNIPPQIKCKVIERTIVIE